MICDYAALLCSIFGLYSSLQLIIFVTMSKQPRSTSTVREVLKDIIHNQNSAPSTHRKHSSLQTIKLNQAVSFLQRKIERQYSEIQVLSEQLSREISLKQELAVLLGEEREKLGKANQHLANANKQNAELKKRIAKLEKDSSEGDTLKGQYEIKLNKYRDIVRKKDELLTKNQQKLQQLLKSERQTIEKEQQIKNLKETVLKLRAKEQTTHAQIQLLKKRQAELTTQAEQQQKELLRCKQQLMFASESISRLQDQNNELNEESTKREIQSASMVQRLSLRIKEQENQINQLIQCRTMHVDRPKWDLLVYKNEMRRIIGSCVKDNNLRKRLQRQTLQLLQQVQHSFQSTLQKVISALQGQV